MEKNNIIEKNNGIIYANKLKEYNISRHGLRIMIEKGLIKRVIHGVYVSVDKRINEFWIMGEKYKNGIYSHNTALYFYNLTDRTPMKLDMTFPDNNRVSNGYLSVHYIKKDNHKLGLQKMKLKDDLEIQIYDLERTICDIVRARNKMDPQIFNYAMKEYMKRKDKDFIKLYKYAKKLRIENVIKKYMEVL